MDDIPRIPIYQGEKRKAVLVGAVYGSSGGKWSSNGTGIYYDKGYVSIGGRSFDSPITVINPDGITSTRIADLMYFKTHVSGAVFRVFKGRGSFDSPLRVRSNDTLGGLNAFGYYAADNTSTATQDESATGQFLFRATEDRTSTAKGTFFTIALVPTGATVLSTLLTLFNDGTNTILRIPNLPTSSAGLSTGDIWVDTTAGNVLKVV